MKRALWFAIILGFGLVSELPEAMLKKTTGDDRGEAGVESISSQTDRLALQQAVENYGQLPLSFEANTGQTDKDVRFMARGAGYSLFLTDGEAVLSLKESSREHVSIPGGKQPGRSGSETVEPSGPPATLRMSLIGSDPPSAINGEELLESRSNYLIGNDPSKWRTDIEHYAKVRYQDVYPGIDQVYYGNQGQLEYDFVVAPEIEHNQIGLRFDGAIRIDIDDASGELVLGFDDGTEVRQQRPIVYQEADGLRENVAAAYVRRSNQEVGFSVGSYDRSRPLVIDPVLVYSTYLGGNGDDQGLAIAVDSTGNAYVTGRTASTNFPTANPIQSAGGGYDAFVTKINATGTTHVYSTYFGGSGDEQGWGIAVDPSGNAYVAGRTASTDLPTVNALQPAFGGGGLDAFVAKLNAAGSALVYSTYLGGSGSDIGNSLALDASGNAYLTGVTASANFPTAAAFQGALSGFTDAFVTKINAAGSALVYSTYLGGNIDEESYAIAVDSSGNAYAAGVTHSFNFPTVAPIQPINIGQYSAFVTKFNATGASLIYSTYLGGSLGNFANAIAVDQTGNAYVTGLTGSTNFPTANAYQAAYGGGATDAFVTKLNPAGSAFVYSTYLGGSLADLGVGIAADPSANAYVTGYTRSANFPTASPIQPANGGSANNADVFVTAFNPTGSTLVYSTYLGGTGSDFGSDIAVDSSSSVFLTGSNQGENFPTANPIQPTYGGSPFDAIVVKIANPAGTQTPTPTPDVTPTPIPATPTPTPTPVPATPTPTPTTPTPTPTITPTPTPTPPTPTPTPTPSPSPTATPAIRFSSTTYVEDESQIAVITLTRTGNTDGTDSVTFSTSNGSANGGAVCSSGVDYVTVTGLILTFNPTDTTKTANVTVCGDLLNEQTETVDLQITGAFTRNGADAPEVQNAVLNINDTATQFRNTGTMCVTLAGTSDVYPSTISVAGGPLAIGSIRVTLYDMSHIFPDHLDVLLVGPGGQKFVVMGDAGGAVPVPSGAPVTLSFRDAAPGVLPDSAPLTTGNFEPTNWETPVTSFPLPAPAGPYSEPGSAVGGTGLQTFFGNFGNTNSNGTWALYLRDDAGVLFASPEAISGCLTGGWGIEFLSSTAADVSISGRVITTAGHGIRNARIVITGNSLPEPRVVQTGSFGYYTFDGLRTGETYIVTVNSRRFTFKIPSRVVSLTDNITDLDFVATPTDEVEP